MYLIKKFNIGILLFKYSQFPRYHKVNKVLVNQLKLCISMNTIEYVVSLS